MTLLDCMLQKELSSLEYFPIVHTMANSEQIVALDKLTSDVKIILHYTGTVKTTSGRIS